MRLAPSGCRCLGKISRSCEVPVPFVFTASPRVFEPEFNTSKGHPLTPTEPNRGLRTDPTETPSDVDTYVSASKVEEGAFMNLTSAIQSIYLKVWVTVQNSGTLRMESIPLTEERTLVHAAGRMFSQGAAEDATKQVRQAQSGFHQKKAEWERRVRQSEDDSARRRAMRELQQKKGCHNPISARISPAESQFRRLVEALDIHVALERTRELAVRQESVNSASASSAGRNQALALPAGFLEAFSAAGAGRLEMIIKQFFDVEAELTVEVAATESGHKTVTFSPPLPKNRLYYFVEPAQVVRLRRVKITSHVYFENLVTQKNEHLTLQSVIESVQAGGLWLLQPKSEFLDPSPTKP